MGWLAVRGLLARRLSTALTGLGLLIATLGFTVLASTSQTAAAALHGDITSTWETPYDLLVRPPDSVTDLERTQGLVRPNYVSGLGNGGITLAQLSAIRDVPSVSVAAPIAISGYAFWNLDGFAITLDRPKPGDPIQVYRMVLGETTDAGTTHLPIEVHYLVVASTGWFRVSSRTLTGVLTADGVEMPCASTAMTGQSVSCWAPNECFDARCGPAEDPPGYGLEMLQPVLVAGIDPVAEAQLTGLRRCLVAGRYFTSEDVPRSANDRDPPGTSLPVLVSDRSFIDATMTGTLDRATDPAAIAAGADPARVKGWTHTADVSRTVDQLYKQYLPRLGEEVDEWPLWSTGDVSYTPGPTGSLVASASPADQQVLQRANFHLFGEGDNLARPPEFQDTWFRKIQQRAYSGISGDKYWTHVGTYDPTCLPGFSPLAGGSGLEAYAVPRVELSDGQYLLPNRSLAGYVNTPPAILTGLDTAAWLADPNRFVGGAGKAFISAVRVKVSGLSGPDSRSERRLAEVAAEIREATGLAVDIVKGSSTKAVEIDLAAGKFGRPPMQVSEAWSVKGVAIRFTQSVSFQNLALFSLALLAALVLVATSTYIASVRRHAEFGVLRALGWPTMRIASLVITENVLLGSAVAAVTIAVAAVPVLAFTPAVMVLVALGALPLALGVSVVASIPAAVATARGSAVSRVVRPTKRRRSRPAGSATSLGITDLLRNWRIEALAAASIIGLGGALLAALVLIAAAFRGELDATVLGADLTGRIRPFHFVLAALIVMIGALGAGQMVSLSYLERKPHFAVLRAMGWSRSQLGRFTATQAVGVGLLGGLITTGATVAATLVTGAQPGPALLAFGVGLAAVASSTAIATALPLVQVLVGTTVSALHEE